MAGAPDQFLECLARERRHHKERVAVTGVLEVADIEGFDDVRMADGLAGGALLVERVEGQRIAELVKRLTATCRSRGGGS
jgi:hypothetical protein